MSRSDTDSAITDKFAHPEKLLLECWMHSGTYLLHKSSYRFSLIMAIGIGRGQIKMTPLNWPILQIPTLVQKSGTYISQKLSYTGTQYDGSSALTPQQTVPFNEIDIRQ